MCQTLAKSFGDSIIMPDDAVNELMLEGCVDSFSKLPIERCEAMLGIVWDQHCSKFWNV